MRRFIHDQNLKLLQLRLSEAHDEHQRVIIRTLIEAERKNTGKADVADAADKPHG